MHTYVTWSDKKGLIAFPLFLTLRAHNFLSRYSMPVNLHSKDHQHSKEACEKFKGNTFQCLKVMGQQSYTIGKAISRLGHILGWLLFYSISTTYFQCSFLLFVTYLIFSSIFSKSFTLAYDLSKFWLIYKVTYLLEQETLFLKFLSGLSLFSASQQDLQPMFDKHIIDEQFVSFDIWNQAPLMAPSLHSGTSSGHLKTVPQFCFGLAIVVHHSFWIHNYCS